jgi:hypothetical protein
LHSCFGATVTLYQGRFPYLLDWAKAKDDDFIEWRKGPRILGSIPLGVLFWPFIHDFNEYREEYYARLPLMRGSSQSNCHEVQWQQVMDIINQTLELAYVYNTWRGPGETISYCTVDSLKYEMIRDHWICSRAWCWDSEFSKPGSVWHDTKLEELRRKSEEKFRPLEESWEDFINHCHNFTDDVSKSMRFRAATSTEVYEQHRVDFGDFLKGSMAS